MQESQQIAVDGWSVYRGRNLLQRDGQSVRVKPRTMDLLVYLADHAGEVVSTEELVDAVWQRRVVGDGTVYRTITDLRQAFGDNAGDARIVETIPKRGYRLVAPVTIVNPESRSHARAFEADRRTMFFAFALFVLTLGVIAFGYALRQTGQPETADILRSPIPPVRRSHLNLGVLAPDSDRDVQIAVSRDGTQLVFSAELSGSSRQIYRLALNELEPSALLGSGGAEEPCFSPDGRWVAFFASEADALKKISVQGGPAQHVANTAIVGGCSWISDTGVVYGGGDRNHGRSLFRVPANGGSSVSLLTTSDGDAGYAMPSILPVTGAALFVLRPGSGGIDPVEARQGSIVVQSLETGEARTLIRGGYAPRFSPTGHIVFAREGALWAVSFDAERLETNGVEVPIVQGVQQDSTRGSASYAFSEDGLLVYVPGIDTGLAPNRTLVWVDKQGREEILRAPPRPYAHPRLSPDGTRVAVSILPSNSQADIWIYHLLRNRLDQLTFGAGIEAGPIWTPDSEGVVFRCTSNGQGICKKSADGAGRVEQLVTTEHPVWPEAISQDGTAVLSQRTDAGYDLHTMSVTSPTTSQPLIETVGNQGMSALSPDGRYLAYCSSETGRYEVYVRTFPDVHGGSWRISNDGGTEPVWGLWGSTGGELFYRGADNSLMSVRLDTTPTFAVRSTSSLFIGQYASSNPATYDVSRDRQRFLFMKESEDRLQTPQPLYAIAVENWFEELKRLAPPSQ